MTASYSRPSLFLRRTLSFAVLALTLAQISTLHSEDAPKASPVPVPTPANPTMPAVASTPLSSEQLDQINASAKGLAGLKSGGSWESTKEWQDYTLSLIHI